MENVNKIDRLFDVMAQEGHELWIVGGAVRDHVMGLIPHDIDLTTTATPDEQIAIYEKHQIRYFATGLQHGTITVVLDEPYEVTTMRVDQDQDGRHATVSYRVDENILAQMAALGYQSDARYPIGELLSRYRGDSMIPLDGGPEVMTRHFVRMIQDSERRDLSFNAMAMHSSGWIFDPHGGRDDIENRVISFVGDPVLRIREDYLRILRYYRFHSRYTGYSMRDLDIAAIRGNTRGLAQISSERIWSELSKILTSANAAVTIREMNRDGVMQAINLRNNIDPIQTTNPVFALMSMGYRFDEVTWLLKSSEEQTAARFYLDRPHYDIELAEIDLVNGVAINLVDELLRIVGEKSIRGWVIPIFPIRGQDMFDLGYRQGREMGDALKRMRDDWIKSRFTLSKDDLLRS